MSARPGPGFLQKLRPASRLWFYPVIWLAALLAHGQSIRSGFVFDDGRLLLENDYVKRWDGLPTLLTHSLFSTTRFAFEGAYYRPLSSLSYWCTWHAFHDNPAPQHAVNILLQLLVASLFARMLLAFGVRRGIALVSALVLAVHPVTAENVDYLGGRQDLMGWAITLACVASLPRLKRATSLAALAFAGVLLSIFCREFFATSAVLLVLAAPVRMRDRSTIKRRLAAAATGATAAIGVDLALRRAFGIVHLPIRSLVTADTPRVLWAAGSRLLRVVLLPTDIASATSIFPTGAGQGLLGGLALVLVLLALVASVRRSHDLLALGALGATTIVLSILLPLYIAQTEWVLGDRYAYETLIGVVLLGSAIAEHALPKLAYRLPSPSVRKLLRVVPYLAVIVAIPLTRGRAFCYQDSEVLAECDAETRPGDPLVLLRRAKQLLAEGQLDRAFPYCTAYLERAPKRRLHVANCIGMWMLIHDRPKQAVPFLQEIAYTRPGWADARGTYFLALALAGEYETARSEIAKWRRRFPGAPDLDASAREVQGIERGDKPELRYQPLPRAVQE